MGYGTRGCEWASEAQLESPIRAAGAILERNFV
jgi:hypothetical protein